MNNFKIIGISLTIGLILGGILVYKLTNTNPKVIKDTQTLEVTKFIDRIIKGKDGETIVEHITEVKKETIEKAKPVIPKVRVGLIGSYDFKEKRSDYGLTLTKPINQQLEVGVYIKPNQQEVGVMASWGF